ncbi:MAG: DNA primase [Patescibacteria group bacterium]
MSEQVEEIKKKVDIVEVISGYVTLKKAGRNYKGNCPFHGEKTPSFMVNPELQIFKCFGCAEGGDVYTFLQKIEGMEFGEVLKTLADRVGVKLESFKPTKIEQEKETLIQINTLAAQAYNFLLTKHKSGKEALEYLNKRGIGDDLISQFNLGFAPDNWNFLEDFLVKKKGYKLDDLEKAGLVVPGRRYDRFRNRIMFPLNNSRGQIVGFAGRILGQSDQAKYVNTPETEIYHKSELLYGYDLTRSEIKKSGRVIVVEGEIDMMASFASGVKNVVAIKGSALTEQQVEMLRRVCETVVLGLDADLAGNMAAKRGLLICEKAGLYVETIDWTQLGTLSVAGAKDVADIAFSSPEEWVALSRKTIPVYKFLINLSVKRFGVSPEGKAKIVKEVLPAIAAIEDVVRRDEYVKELAVASGVEVEVLRLQMNINSKHEILTSKQATKGSIGMSNRREIVEEYVVGLALRAGKVEQLVSEPVNQWIKTRFWRKTIDFVSSIEYQVLSIGEIVAMMPGELRPKVEELMLKEGPEDDEEWGKAISELERVEIQEKMKVAEPPEVAILSRRKAELTRGL